jgi:hypothetical protein
MPKKFSWEPQGLSQQCRTANNESLTAERIRHFPALCNSGETDGLRREAMTMGTAGKPR